MIAAALRRLYHAVVPLGVRRALRLTRFTASRRARAGLWRSTGGRVAAGPFKGLRLQATTAGDCEAPVLLGSYECETHEWLEREVARGWATVVNVGSNSGFYSSGLALRLPRAIVYAFEMDDALRAATAKSADTNGVAGRVRALGTANPAALAALPITGALVVCDCEGCERDLLDPALVPWLAQSAILVELHDFAAAGATDTIRTRFLPTHDIAIVEQGPRDASAWAVRAGIGVRDAAILSEDPRPWNGAVLPGRWMLLSPRTTP